MRRTSAATTPPSESFTTSPGTSSAAGMVFHAPSRRTDAFSASRDFSAARVAWARLSWNSPSAALNTRRAGDDRGLDIFAERQFEHDRGLEHPRNGRPEFLECHAQRMQRRIWHRVGAELLQPPARLVACQAVRRTDIGHACRPRR